MKREIGERLFGIAFGLIIASVILLVFPTHPMFGYINLCLLPLSVILFIIGGILEISPITIDDLDHPGLWVFVLSCLLAIAFVIFNALHYLQTIKY